MKERDLFGVLGAERVVKRMLDDDCAGDDWNSEYVPGRVEVGVVTRSAGRLLMEVDSTSLVM